MDVGYKQEVTVGLLIIAAVVRDPAASAAVRAGEDEQTADYQ